MKRLHFVLIGFVLAVATLAWAQSLPTTLADFTLPGSQPGQSGSIEAPSQCSVCHAGYDRDVEPQFNWRGSMMAHAARDPLFYAALTIANQDAPWSGDACIRCHSPGGWLGGRSVPTDGSALSANDRQGVQCAFCHGLVKPAPVGVNPYPDDATYSAGTWPADQSYLGTLGTIPPVSGSGMYVVDASDMRRGPRGGITAPHTWAYSPFHRDAALCGTCHDVSNPLFSRDSTGAYLLNANGQPAPSADSRDVFPVERTFSEWRMSEYNSPAGVYAPQFGGNKPNVSTCQDCHMRDVTGKASNRPSGPVRSDLALHDLTGGNTFIPRLVADLYAAEVDTAELNDGMQRARYMLQNAAHLDLQVSPLWNGWRARVRVTNETGHKLPSGYPEGRRMWIQVQAWDEADLLVYESGAYDTATATLVRDTDAKVYECELGISAALSPVVGLPAGQSFHFILNDQVYKDNRIPPRGFTNAGFAAVQAAPVGAAYADGQHWDDTDYDLPAATRRVTATLWYQTTSREYVEFLRDANTTDTRGETLYQGWLAHGKSTPETMATASDTLQATTEARAAGGGERLALTAAPRGDAVRFVLVLPRAGRVTLHVYDVRSRRVATLADAVWARGRHVVEWPTHSHASGFYFARLQSPDGALVRKVAVVH